MRRRGAPERAKPRRPCRGCPCRSAHLSILSYNWCCSDEWRGNGNKQILLTGGQSTLLFRLPRRDVTGRLSMTSRSMSILLMSKVLTVILTLFRLSKSPRPRRQRMLSVENTSANAASTSTSSSRFRTLDCFYKMTRGSVCSFLSLRQRCVI